MGVRRLHQGRMLCSAETEGAIRAFIEHMTRDRKLLPGEFDVMSQKLLHLLATARDDTRLEGATVWLKGTR